MQSALIVIAGSKDLFNFYSCRFNGVGLEVDGQKTFLISTLVDKGFLTELLLSKDLFNFYSCRYRYYVKKGDVKRPF